MDMRSLEHCLNDITNTAGVQSDLKGELRSHSSAFNRFWMRIVRSGTNCIFSSPSIKPLIIIRQLEDAHEKRLSKSSLKSVYKRLAWTFPNRIIKFKLNGCHVMLDCAEKRERYVTDDERVDQSQQLPDHPICCAVRQFIYSPVLSGNMKNNPSAMITLIAGMNYAANEKRK